MSTHGHRPSTSLSLKGQNYKAQLANAYNELGKELSSSKIKVVGNYTLGKVIGEGTYGKVRLGTHRITSTRVAVKQIPKAVSSSLTREIHHHRQLHHPHVTQMYEVIATETSVWIITELCSGGELFDYLVEKGRLCEDETRLLFGQLCLAVAYLHDKGIVHRDLKLENILLDERCRIKLGDFGFTREFERGTFMETFCGTTGYASPEMLQGKKYQGPEVDIWSLGVILYCLLTGTLPFDDDDESVMREKVIKGEFDDPEWLSPESRDLIKKILQKDPLRRLTIRQIFSHAWFAPSHRDPTISRDIDQPRVRSTSHIDIDNPPPINFPTEDARLVISPTTFESISLNGSLLFDTPKPNGASSGHGTSTYCNSSEATLPVLSDEETYQQFKSRMAPHLNIVTTDPSDTHPHIRPDQNETNGNDSILHNGESLHPLSATSGSSKSHPPSAVRTPVRTKRRSVSSNLSTPPSSPTTDKANALPPASTATTSTQYPHQDFSALLNTPAPIIFSTPLERELLTSLSALGLDTAQIVHSVLSDACDASGALWWMLKRKAEKKVLEGKEVKIPESPAPVPPPASPPPTVGTTNIEPGPRKPSTRSTTIAVKSGKRSAPTVSVSVQTDIVSAHAHTLNATRSAPQLAFVPPTPTFSPPETPPKSRSPTQTHLSPSPTPTAAGSSRSHPSTPSGSLRDKGRDKGDGLRGKGGRPREGKARSGSVSIMQRATTALEAAGLVRKKSSEVVREEKEREKEREKEKERIASGEEPRSSYGSSSSKLTKSGHGHGRTSNAASTTAPSTPPSESQPTQVGSPWVMTEAQQASPPSTIRRGAGAPTPANSPGAYGDPFISPSLSAPAIATGKQPGRTRHRASLLTTFRLWFNDDRKGKRKDPNPNMSATTSASAPRGSIHAHRVSSSVSGRRMSGSGAAGSMSARKVAHRSQRPSVSSRRSSSANSRRSSAASAQIILLDPPLVIEQKPARRSIGTHTPNSERGEYPSRPSSVRSSSGQGQAGQVHRKSPSASSASSMHFRTSSPMSKYNSHSHKRVNSGSSTRVVRQIHPPHHHHHGPRHGRSNSTSSSVHTPSSSRPTSFYEFPSEQDGNLPRNASPFRSNRRSLDDGRSNSIGSSTTFVAQKRQTPFTSPSSGSTSISRSGWKKSWGLEPPGWQSRTAAQSLLPIEVLAVSPATGTSGDVRDVFSGKGSASGSGAGPVAGHLNLGDESDWVDEDDEIPAFAGGLGQTAAPATMSGSGSGSTSISSSATANSAPASFAKVTAESTAIQLSPPPSGRRGIKQRSNRSGGAGVVVGTPTAVNANRSKPGHSSTERAAVPTETNYDELRGGRRQLPPGRSGPAFRHAIQEEDEGEEE